jgi:hypothetical protein
VCSPGGHTSPPNGDSRGSATEGRDNADLSIEVQLQADAAHQRDAAGVLRGCALHERGAQLVKLALVIAAQAEDVFARTPARAR